ncbi:MAG: endopeptidase La [Candidatus Sumerlaeia bacterium]
MSEDIHNLPVLPLKNTVLFPGLMMPLSVGRPQSLHAVESALAREDKTLLAVSQKDADLAEPKFGDLFHVGTRAVIKKLERSEERLQIIVQGLDRAATIAADQEQPFIIARYRLLSAPEDSGTEIEALTQAMLEEAGKIFELVNPQAHAAILRLDQEIPEPLQQVYLLASLLALDTEKEQALLAANTRAEALRLMIQYLTHERQVAELRQRITNQAQTEMTKQQREYLLRQQMQAIQQELGEQDLEHAEITELRKRLDEAELPDEARDEARRELARLERMPPAAPDYQLTRTYVELLIEMPWRKSTDDNLDIAHARQVLDEDHFDLEDIKERILEQLAVLKLNPAANAPILCFVGPPGVGKTSLGKSIARSLNRKFERMSLGGMHDEAELRGHRRTYIGAMPGRIIQAIRRAGVRNPLLMLDEVDKLAHDWRGDPSSALLEVLDPAQNFEFRDNYLNLAFDLSKVFFITTANTLDTIPTPLLDRMEVIHLAGYSDEEKKEIARRYLVARQVAASGLKPDQIRIPDDTVMEIIHRYTREAGVRELERTLGSLCRKVARRFAEGRTEPVAVAPADLGEWLGPERFFEEDARKQLDPGVAIGLAYTPVGGVVLYIEAVMLREGAELTLTGQLGDVMKESARAALSFIRAHLPEFDPGAPPATGSVHIHVPAGATPKDGPSAGVAMATALASLFTGKPMRQDTAMTGEITLTGLVLPIGGLKEKILAAHRAGLKRVILPRRNMSDLADLPDHIRNAMEFIPVDRISDVIEAAIPQLAKQARAA